MPIRKLFHFMHIVDDFDTVSDLYTALFAPHIYAPKHWSDFDKRWASLAVIGSDFVLEIMEPGKDPADANAPLPKFFGRHGEHLHSFAWFVDAADFSALGQRLQEGGIRVITPYGSITPKEGEDGPNTFFTHPKDTHGQLEFQSWTPDSWGAPHTKDGWSGAFWSDEHPLGLLGMSHLTTVVADLDRARSFYETYLDAPVFFEEKTADRHSAYVLVGDDTIVELATPTTPDSHLARDLAVHGELPHAMTFRVRDLEAAKHHVTSIGVRFESSPDTITLDLGDMFNAVVAFTTRRLPNDPRGS